MMMANLIIISISVILSFLVVSSQGQARIQNHIYRLVIPTPASNYSAAVASLAAGEYLATITSQAEYDFVTREFAYAGLVMFLGGGRDVSSSSSGGGGGLSFRWTQGPCGYYNVPVTQGADPNNCPHFCNWGPSTPSQVDTPVLALSYSGGSPLFGEFADWTLYDARPYLVESGSADVLCTRVSTVGGNTTISLLDPTYTIFLNLTMTSPSDYSVYIDNIFCPVSNVEINPLRLTCFVPAGQGHSLPVLVQYFDAQTEEINTLVDNLLLFDYEPPEVDLIDCFECDGGGDRYYLTGRNFGTNLSAINITFAGNGNSQCFLSLISPDYIECWTLFSISNFLPLFINTASGLQIRTNSVALQKYDTGSYFRVSREFLSYDLALAYATTTSLTVYPSGSHLQGYIATITSPSDFAYIRLFTSFRISGSDHGNETYRYDSGPEAGLLISRGGVNYTYSDWIEGQPAAEDGDDTIAYSESDDGWVGLPRSTPLRFLIEYGTPPPDLRNPSFNYLGGYVTISGLAFGPLKDNHTITLENRSCEIDSYNNYHSIVFKIPSINETFPSSGVDLPLVVTYLDQIISPANLTFSYTDGPVINFIDPVLWPPSWSGAASISISGSNFGFDRGQVVVFVGPYRCEISDFSPRGLYCNLSRNASGLSLQVKVQVHGQYVLSRTPFSFPICGDNDCQNITAVPPPGYTETCFSCPQDCCPPTTTSSSSSYTTSTSALSWSSTSSTSITTTTSSTSSSGTSPKDILVDRLTALIEANRPQNVSVTSYAGSSLVATIILPTGFFKNNNNGNMASYELIVSPASSSLLDPITTPTTTATTSSTQPHQPKGSVLSTILDLTIKGRLSGTTLTGRFDVPVGISFKASAVSLPFISLADLCLAYYDAPSTSWRCEDSELVQTDDGGILGFTHHFTPFAILVSSSALQPDANGGTPVASPTGLSIANTIVVVVVVCVVAILVVTVLIVVEHRTGRVSKIMGRLTSGGKKEEKHELDDMQDME
eukprot:TRINITY_DN4822_c0_g1_i5.p1 TRINITY_DN4822_c0_g1~~TRINITY_DN4822_c0_g1_i5.p1  ORF type:complete len:1001 (-),score=126.26 TRINITY_DN4822_c0_g1_i5:11-3013(-)